jgi:hypothetical protein
VLIDDQGMGEKGEEAEGIRSQSSP